MGDKEAGSVGDLVVVNVGNTHCRVVRYAGECVSEDRRVPTAGLLAGEPAPPLPPDLPVVLVSVVPSVSRVLQDAWGDRQVFIVRADAASGMKIAYDPPVALGADRLANAFALYRRFGGGLAIDFGTATTLTAVGPGGVLVGGAIMPGLATAVASLWRGTAQLPEVPVVDPGVTFGRTTAESIQVGVVHGQAGAIRYLAERMRLSLAPDMPVVITGGWSTLMRSMLPEDFQHHPEWTLEGARDMYLCSTRNSG